VTNRYLRLLTRAAAAAAFVLIVQLVAFAPAQAAGSFSVYFVAVGSSDYGQPRDADTHGLNHIYGANKSAKAISARLLAGGAKYGVLLTSSEGHLISRGDVAHAISLVAAKVTADRPRNPLLLFYFAGHGVSEGVGWNLFLVPGTFLYTGDLADHDIESIAGSTLPAAKLVDQLNQTGVRYLAVLDTCYEGKAAKFESSVLSGAAVTSLKNVAGILRFMNQFHQASPVLFSTTPGTVVETTDDPVDGGPVPVAPLARRMMILLDKIAVKKGLLTLNEFVQDMASKDLDSKTTPAISNASPTDDWKETLLSYASNSGEVAELTGTAPAAEKCCASAPTASPPVQNKLSGTVEIRGSKGEFITGGTTIKFSGTLVASQDDPSSLTLSFAEKDSDWELSFGVSPGSLFRTGNFANAVRYSFAEKGQSSMAITGAGHACNEVRGSFAVEDLKRDSSGRVAVFTAGFEQYCDDNKVPLQGRVSVAAK
jgi:hypothetical protein